jgi:hypothetical protein
MIKITTDWHIPLACIAGVLLSTLYTQCHTPHPSPEAPRLFGPASSAGAGLHTDSWNHTDISSHIRDVKSPSSIHAAGDHHAIAPHAAQSSNAQKDTAAAGVTNDKCHNPK